MFLPVPAFPAYEVSDTGVVRRVRDGYVLAQSSIRGYKVLTLFNAGAGRLCRIHRLVLLAHVGPPPTPQHQAAHNDGTRDNNTLANLRWATPQENSDDTRRHGTQARNFGDRNGARTKPECIPRGAKHYAHTKPHLMVRGERHGNTRLTETDIRAIRADTRTHQAIADELGVSRVNITNIKSGRTWSHVT